MECANCGSQLESNWTHCPHCGKFKSVFKQPIDDETVDGIYGRMFKAGKEPKDAKTKGKATGDAADGSYGSGVRAQVFEVIVRQAMAGAPWREICEAPMRVNKISPEEVDAEVERRSRLLGSKLSKLGKKSKDDKSAQGKKSSAAEKDKTADKDSFFQGSQREESDKLGFPDSPPRPSFDPQAVISPSIRLQKLYQKLNDFLDKAVEEGEQKKYSHKLLEELTEIMNSIVRMETLLHTIQTEISVTADLERELRRTARPFDPPDHKNEPHRIDW